MAVQSFEADYNAQPVTHRDRLNFIHVDRDRAFRKAQLHSRLVRSLQLALPILAVAAVGLYFLPNTLSVQVGGVTASIKGISASSKELTMVNPRLQGVSAKYGSYVVTAVSATQKVKAPHLVGLKTIDARIDNRDKSWSKLTADKGKFNTKTEQLQLAGNIKVKTNSQMSARLSTARVDMKKQTITSKTPVEVTMPTGKVSGRSMFVDSGKNIVDFRGNVRVHMEPPKKPKAQTEATESQIQPGLNMQSDAPTDITAQRLQIFDDKSLALFTGNVLVLQGGTRLRSEQLQVQYQGSARSGTDAQDNEAESVDPAAMAAQTKIVSLRAERNVNVTLENGQKVRSQWLVHDESEQTLTMGDNVILTGESGQKTRAKKLVYNLLTKKAELTGGVTLAQAGNILKGESLVANMATKTAVLLAKGKVKGIFQPQSGGKTSSKKPKLTTPKTTGTANAFGQNLMTLSSNNGAPVHIEAKRLNVDDARNQARFLGEVVAKQGAFVMRADQIDISYKGSGFAMTGQSTSQEAAGGIKLVKARDNILIRTPDGQTSKSEWAEFNPAAQTVTIGGNVFLTQGKNVIKGDKLVIDLKTGQSRIDRTSDKRIRGLFMTGRQSGRLPWQGGASDSGKER